MRYSITSDLKILPMNWEKYIFHWEKWNFELIANSAHMAEPFVLGNSLKNLYQLLDVLPKQTTCDMKTLQVQVYIQQSIHNDQAAKYL